MAKDGSKRVEIAGVEDKTQITAVFGDTMAGDFLPPQLIYQGKTCKSPPLVVFPCNWHVMFTENHWLNEKMMVDYLEKILSPYIDKKDWSSSLTQTTQPWLSWTDF